MNNPETSLFRKLDLTGFSGGVSFGAGRLQASVGLSTSRGTSEERQIGPSLGGFTSLPGTVVGGLLLGVLENFVGVYISTAYKDAITFLLLVAILIVKPQGLLGREQARRV